MEEMMKFVGQVGFPIVVAGWLLVKFENKLDAAEVAMRSLGERLEMHLAQCVKCRESQMNGNCERRESRSNEITRDYPVRRSAG